MIMYFDAQALPCVEEFVKKHYKGGTVIDFGCGCGRYTHLFPDDMYLGVDGHEGNIQAAKKRYPNKQFAFANLEDGHKGRKFDYLFSSVVFDQVENLPKGWAKNYILIEPSKYAETFKPQINEPVTGSEGTRMMLCKTHLK